MDYGGLVKETLTLKEAMMGFSKQILHLDGKNITLKREKTTQPGFVQQIPKLGMPKYHQGKNVRGDLFVEYQVVLPTEIGAQKSEWMGFFNKVLSSSSDKAEL